MGEQLTVGRSAERATAPAANNYYDAPASHENLSQGQSAEALLLKEILVAMERLNVSMTKMERSMTEMVNQGVKVKWLK